MVVAVVWWDLNNIIVVVVEFKQYNCGGAVVVVVVVAEFKQYNCGGGGGGRGVVEFKQYNCGGGVI